MAIVLAIFPSTSFAANTQTEAEKALSALEVTIPAGYKVIAAIPMNTGNPNLSWVVCSYSSGGNSVLVRLRNLGTTAITAQPRVNLICIKS